MNLKATFICILVCFALIPSIQVSASLYDDWTYQINILIDHTKIDAELTDFPIYLEISNSSGITDTDLTPIFDEIGNNYTQMLVTTESLVSCYVEVVPTWNATLEYAELWVKVPYINNETDTQLRLYFGAKHSPNNLYIGLTGSNVAEQVWVGYVMVQHMNDVTTSTITDSTSNDNNGAKKAANEPIEMSGKIGKAQDFDGNDDDITITSVADLNFNGADDFTLECWAKFDDRTTKFRGLITKSVGSADGYNLALYPLNPWSLNFYLMDNTSAGVDSVLSATLLENVWYHCVVTREAGVITKLYVNTVTTSVADNGYDPNTIQNLKLGNYNSNELDGLMDEVRISKGVARSSAWVGASYQTQNDSLLTIGAPTTEPPAPTSGLVIFAFLGFIIAICALALVMANKKR